MTQWLVEEAAFAVLDEQELPREFSEDEELAGAAGESRQAEALMARHAGLRELSARLKAGR